MRMTRREAALGAGLAGLGLGGAGKASVASQVWGRTPDGQEVRLYTLTSPGGATARIMDYGGVIVGLTAPDRQGRMADVALGFDSFEPYLTRSPSFGAVIGRFANRIGGGRFVLDGVEYHPDKAPNAPHSSHGGRQGWSKRVWKARPFTEKDAAGLELTLHSPDGDQGFPGAVDVAFTYRLTRQGWLTMRATATTTKPTVINMTNHNYFNLAGHDSGDILGHELRIAAERYTPVDATVLPTGEIVPVAGTPFDFRQSKPIGRDIAPLARGYDNNWVLDGPSGKLRFAARARDPKSGRTLEVWTDQPGLQLYTARNMNLEGAKGGVHYRGSQGFALEAQHFPDSPNKPQFPSTVLRPGETFRWATDDRLGVS